MRLANRSESAGPLWVITTNTTRVPNQKSPRQNARAVSVCVKWKSNLARRQRRCKHNFAFRRKRIIGFGVSSGGSMQPVCFGWLLVHIRSWSAVPRWSTRSHRSIPQLVRTPSKPPCAWSKLSHSRSPAHDSRCENPFSTALTVSFPAGRCEKNQWTPQSLKLI